MGRELEMLKITRFITNNINYFPFQPSKQINIKNGEKHCGKKRRNDIEWQEIQIVNSINGRHFFVCSREVSI